MSTKEKIIEYLKEKYDPEAIILHGSRVRGSAGERSDWDFFLITEQEREILPEEFEDELLDIEAITLPLADNAVKGVALQLRHGEVVYDPGGVTDELLDRAKEIQEEGPNFSKKEVESRRNFLLRYLNRMRDRRTDQGAFFLYVGIFYEKAVKDWFEILHNEWWPPIYDALDIIKERDPEFFALLEVVYERNETDEKIVAAEEIYERIFNSN